MNIKTVFKKYKRPKFLEKVPYTEQAILCVISAVIAFILLYFNLFFSATFSIISFVFFTMTKPHSRMDYNNRWFATMGFILALTTLVMIILTHVIVNSVFGLIVQ